MAIDIAFNTIIRVIHDLDDFGDPLKSGNLQIFISAI